MTTHRTLRAANLARQAEWDPDQQISLSYRGNELGGECGEAQNVIKKLERERLGIRGSRATLDDLAQELADVVICADLIAMAAGIDLDQAVAAKFNATSEKVGLATRLKIAMEALPGATYQKSETITLTAEGDETFAELRKRVAPSLPEPFTCAGGLDRIRKGDPILGSKDRVHDRDQQAHVAFVAHHPRQALAALEGGV